jgi:hypothetical protein
MPDIDPAALIRRRRNALLAKWAAGKKLSAQELEEIGPYLPVVAPAAVAPALVLEAQVEGYSEKTYRGGRETYAKKYGQSIRTINRWMKQKAPLDDPLKMIDWWPTCHSHKVPDELLAAVSTPNPPAVETLGAVDETISLDPAITPLDQARVLLNSTYAELLTAQKIGDREPGRLARAQRSYTQASEQLRRIELADPKIRAAAGAVVDRNVVKSALSRLHTSIEGSLRSYAKKARREMAGKDIVEQESIWQAGLEEIFARFRHGDFAFDA